MINVFTTVLKMSITASYVALIVMATRLLIKKAPKVFSFALWFVVLFRLLCPFTFESDVSIIPHSQLNSYQRVSTEIATHNAPTIDGIVNNSVNGLEQMPQALAESGIKNVMVASDVLAIIWIIGVIGMLSYGFISYSSLKIKLSTATVLKKNIFETDRIVSPFVLGIVKPKIYVPIGLSNDELDFIIRHEETHIARYDHLIKPIYYVALAFHWFNPVIWISFILMSRDMEMSCDEIIMRNVDDSFRKNYSTFLLAMANKQKNLFTSLAFNESNTKERIINIMHYKKPTFWVVIVALVVVSFIGFGLLSNPSNILSISNQNTLNPSDVWLYHMGCKAWYPISGPEDQLATLIESTIIDSLPDKIDIYELSLNNEMVQNDFFETETCIELIFDKPTPLTFINTKGKKLTYDNYDKILISLTKDEGLLMFSKDGEYQNGPIGKLDVEKLMDLYPTVISYKEIVNYSDGMVEIMGEKLSYKNEDMSDLYEVFTPEQVDRAMFRSVAFYSAAHARKYDIVTDLATDSLKREMQKWADNQKSAADVLMKVEHYTDATFPKAISTPQFDYKNNNRLVIFLDLDDYATAQVEVIINDKGDPLVDQFYLMME